MPQIFEIFQQLFTKAPTLPVQPLRPAFRRPCEQAFCYSSFLLPGGLLLLFTACFLCFSEKLILTVRTLPCTKSSERGMSCSKP